MNDLQEFLTAKATELGVPGATAGVIVDGKEITAFHGVTSVENPLDVDEKTLFQFGSTGKTFTATAIMRLVEQGKLDLDAPVRTYVPELRLKDEDAARALFRNTEHQNHKPFEQWAVTLVGGRYNEQKGMDRGVDGVIDLYDMQGNHRQGVIQIKGGNGLNASNVRDFAHVIERENAVFGIMIGQKEPTPEMVLTATKLGYADWPGNKKIPRYQILTTEGILERGESAVIPENWLQPRQKGVGHVEAKQTETLFDATETESDANDL